jgi:hypothetical protein
VALAVETAELHRLPVIVRSAMSFFILYGGFFSFTRYRIAALALCCGYLFTPFRPSIPKRPCRSGLSRRLAAGPYHLNIPGYTAFLLTFVAAFVSVQERD